MEERVVTLDVHEICRTCLRGRKLTDIIEFESETAQWVADIKRYFNVKILFDSNKSTKICSRCIRKIKNWRIDMQQSVKSQIVVNYLDRVYEAQNMSTIKKEYGT